jgi:hypothetical protein
MHLRRLASALLLPALLGAAACGSNVRDSIDGNPGAGDGTAGNGDGQQGCGGVASCYSVYAHSDHVLYVIDLNSKALNAIGKFNAPKVNGTEENITDLAVAPDNTIYVISETTLFTASAQDGHVTKVGSLATCGTKAVALTTTPDGKIFTGDYSGNLCQIDIASSPPVVKPPIKMSGGLALTGDLAAIGNGTVYGTAYKLSDSSGGTQTNNLLVTIDLATGATTSVGATGFPKLFGTAYALGKVFGFTHDGTGHVVTIDAATGVGTLFGTFTDPTTHAGISFAGAGVNSLVPPLM